MKLSNLELLKLIPIFMRDDEAVGAMADVVNAYTHRVDKELPLIRKWDQIDSMNNPQLDELAYELNVLWYDTGASVETKRRLIKKSDMVYARLGTKWAVEEIVAAYFGSARVEEWFEYGGAPHYFKAILSIHPTAGMKQQFLSALERVKRKSQWLQTIVYENVTSVHNEEKFALLALRMGTRVNNFLVRPVLFDERVHFDGGIRFDQQIVGHFYLRNLSCRLRLEHPEMVKSALIAKGKEENRQRFISKAIGIRSAWQERETPLFHRCTAVGAVTGKNELTARNSYAVWTGNQNEAISGIAISGTVRTREISRHQRLFVCCHVHNRNRTAALLVTDTLYTFDGRYAFDGVRRFNADKVTEEV